MTEGETDEKVVWGQIIRACIHLLGAAMLTGGGTKAVFTCVLPLGVRRTVKCETNRNLCHFFFFLLLDFASFFLNTSMNMLLLECQKHEKYNVKVGKVFNLIIYIY